MHFNLTTDADYKLITHKRDSGLWTLKTGCISFINRSIEDVLMFWITLYIMLANYENTMRIDSFLTENYSRTINRFDIQGRPSSSRVVMVTRRIKLHLVTPTCDKM